MLCGELLADLERYRPALPAQAGEADILAQLTQRAEIRLAELYREFRVDESDASLSEDSQFALYKREVETVLLPRYARIAQTQNRHEQAPRLAWQGRDLYNRLSYALGLFLLGVFIVWAPFIPIWEKWIPFALAALAPLLSPFLPDLYGAWLNQKHQLALFGLHEDLDQLGRALPLPPVTASSDSKKLLSGATGSAQSASAAAVQSAARKDAH
jgi:hypothetical protein